MISMGLQEFLQGHWWIYTFPGLAILVAVLGFNLLGDGLQDILDPRRRGGADMAGEPLLSIRNLQTYFYTRQGTLKVLDGLSLDLAAGQILGLVGETGSGKSVTGASILRLVKRPGRVVGGEIRFAGRDLLKLSDREMDRVRGREVAMVFQNPRGALNPLLTVGELMGQVLRHHEGLSRRAARRRAAELLSSVHIPDPERRLDAYPHQLSGGMAQRVMIALAISCSPKLLIADEPTTGLDVTTQYQIVQLLREMRDRTGVAVILITHDLGLAAELCDRIAVMYLGEVVESGTVADLFTRPRHPYTQGLLRSRPKLRWEGELPVIPGDVPDPLARPTGCTFHTRCPFAVPECAAGRPPQVQVPGGQLVACHRWEVTS